MRVRLFVPAFLVAAICAPAVAAAPSWRLPIRVVRFDYRTHDGRTSYALLLLPGWYGPHDDPAIPLVISPHGRNTLPASDAKRWSDLPARGRFAVVLPAGQGRVFRLYSWGYPGQIDDLASMPQLIRKALPWFHYERRRVYAVGASMGGQEALLLLAHAPRLLAGVIAFDPAVDLTARYYAFPHLRFGRGDQERCRIEVGGSPSQVPEAYRVRSPSTYVRRIARSGVPLELWWSLRDQVIRDQADQTGRLYEELEQDDPEAPVVAFVGTWRHAGEVGADYRLPYALARIGLLPRYWLHHDPYRRRHRPAEPLQPA
jgi:pimeloyl-ACP methyl ester carboxylesterase